MSRLDDELREAFRRHDPSPDFAARVIELAARQPEPKKNGWKQTLIELFQPPKLRWVAIAVTASLLIAIAGGAYRNLYRVHSAETKEVTTAQDTTHREDNPKPLATAEGSNATVHKSAINPGRAPSNHHAQSAAQRERQRELRARGEAAKERVLFALGIASATLKDAQRSINDDTYKTEPKP